MSCVKKNSKTQHLLFSPIRYHNMKQAHLHLFHELKHLLWGQTGNRPADGLWSLVTSDIVPVRGLNDGCTGAQT